MPISPDELMRALLDPTAPLPACWPSGALGVFLLFCLPIGGGIPFGVIMARNTGLSPLSTAGLYLLSDVALAITVRPSSQPNLRVTGAGIAIAPVCASRSWTSARDL